MRNGTNQEGPERGAHPNEAGRYELGNRLVEICRITDERLEQMSPLERDQMLRNNLETAYSAETKPRATRVIFEYGLDFIRQGGDTWHLVTGEEIATSPCRIQRETGLRPIIAWVTNGRSKVRSYVLPLDYDLTNIDTTPICVTQIFGNDSPKLFPAWRFRYHVHGIAHRLLSLATHYVWRSRKLDTDQSNAAIFDGAEDLAYEAEACITAAIRLIDVLREAYRDRFGVPDGFGEHKGWEELIKSSIVQPNQLILCIQNAWDNPETGIKMLNRYRNVIEHRAPLAGRCPWTERVFFPGTGTGCSLWIPDDPFTDPKSFAYRQRKDALTYCWKASVRVIEIARKILKVAGEYPSIYPYPDEDNA